MSDTDTMNIDDLLTFTLSPDMIQNLSKHRVSTPTDPTSPRQNNTMSSAKMRCVSLVSSQFLWKRNGNLLVSFLMRRERISMHATKMSGDNGSPWRMILMDTLIDTLIDLDGIG